MYTLWFILTVSGNVLSFSWLCLYSLSPPHLRPHNRPQTHKPFYHLYSCSPPPPLFFFSGLSFWITVIGIWMHCFIPKKSLCPKPHTTSLHNPPPSHHSYCIDAPAVSSEANLWCKSVLFAGCSLPSHFVTRGLFIDFNIMSKCN
jgi:hypothetical protein